MRPTCNALRYAYRAAAARVKSKEKEVTIRALADELEVSFKTAQRYLYRNQEVAQEVGLEVEHVKHGLSDYTTAILSIPSQLRPTCRRISALLRIDQTSVGRFIKRHPELRALHPRFETLHCADASNEEVGTFVRRRWIDLYVSVWHELTGRYVGIGVTRDQYLDYWANNLLKHQREGLPKPRHLPAPEEVELML